MGCCLVLASSWRSSCARSAATRAARVCAAGRPRHLGRALAVLRAGADVGAALPGPEQPPGPRRAPPCPPALFAVRPGDRCARARLGRQLLLASGVAEAEGLSPWVRALGLGAFAVALVAGIGAPRDWLDLPSVLVVAGGTAFVLGLVDMHALAAFSLGSAPSLTVDLLVHGAPLTVVAVGAALELRRPSSPLVSGVR